MGILYTAPMRLCCLRALERDGCDPTNSMCFQAPLIIWGWLQVEQERFLPTLPFPMGQQGAVLADEPLPDAVPARRCAET